MFPRSCAHVCTTDVNELAQKEKIYAHNFKTLKFTKNFSKKSSILYILLYFIAFPQKQILFTL